MMIYSIKLAKGKDETKFEQFMEEKIFPAIDKGVSRSGQVNRLVLLKGNNTGHTNEYLWLIYGTVNGGAANSHLDDIKAFGTQVAPLQDFVECASWTSHTTESKSV